ncbi:putative F-box associated interaction domain-containing protein [Lupinus albus]|uniref:Putative F-box associated interaction domain-containing protein n=1 Tax=Lupinus albus TaxID=3870 RepID=A0A6A4Q9V1_LUPAL|nr:putative F-box associated interaction domain-containing protein [Lupinus albus]
MTMFQKFVSDYSFHSRKRKQLLILDRFYWNGQICCHNLFLVDPKMKDLKELNVPLVSDCDMGFKVISTCNGLVCVLHYSIDQSSCLFLWNPLTMQTKPILEPQNSALLLYKVPPNCLIGFYFNQYVNDYEVVRVHSFEDIESACLDDYLIKVCVVRVEKYSRRSGLWREIECYGPSVFVNGILFWTENCVTLEEKKTLFWIAMEVSEKINHEVIIYFNFKHSNIGKIEFPYKSKDCSEVYKKVAVYNDSLALLICSENKCMEQCLNLWVFHDEYEDFQGWSKLFTIGMLSRLECLVGIWKDEVLMATPKVLHCGSRIMALLQGNDLISRFSYNVFNYDENNVPL